jgi:hypothetical protein
MVSFLASAVQKLAVPCLGAVSAAAVGVAVGAKPPPTSRCELQQQRPPIPDNGNGAIKLQRKVRSWFVP